MRPKKKVNNTFLFFRNVAENGRREKKICIPPIFSFGRILFGTFFGRIFTAYINRPRGKNPKKSESKKKKGENFFSPQ